jgi:hypothetical protein
VASVPWSLWSAYNHEFLRHKLKTGPLKEYISSYVELDFPENTTKKAMAIRKSKQLSRILGEEVKVGKFNILEHPSRP